MPPTTHRTSTATRRELLAATDRALAEAHGAHLHEAMRAVRWERRGLLGRLTRA